MNTSYHVEEETYNDLHDRFYDADQCNDQQDNNNLQNDTCYAGDYNDFNNNGYRNNKDVCDNNGSRNKADMHNNNGSRNNADGSHCNQVERLNYLRKQSHF